MVFAVTFAAFFAFTELRHKSTGTALQVCVSSGKHHTAVIKNDRIQPQAVHADRCDTLTVVNKDQITREIGFGQHDRHVAYDGVKERMLLPNQSLTITLNKTGDYHYHDHFHDEVEGTFTVQEAL